MQVQCLECATYLADDRQININRRQMRIVVFFNLCMMLGEIIVGYRSGSMALVAEGWHMGSHVGALSIALIAYRLATSERIHQRLTFGGGKFLPLGGYTSAIVLGIVAITVLIESALRLLHPEAIEFNSALVVASLGFGVNFLSAWLLRHDHRHHHDDDHNHAHDQGHGHVHDHNIRSAFLHVLADGVTSFLAVLALTLGKYFHWNWLDPVIGIVGAVVIGVWAVQLLRSTGRELLDSHVRSIDWARLRGLVENDHTQIIDFHSWRIAPTAVACELVVTTRTPRGPDYYRSLLRKNFSVQHVVVEERTSKPGAESVHP